jgi:hypothetical protein
MAIIKPGQLSSGSYSISGSFSGSFFGDGSNLANLPIPQIETGSFVTTSSFNAFTGSYNTGSFTGSFIGDGSGLIGIVSASYALTASYTVSASFVQNAQTASYVLNAVSASFSTTASYALNNAGGDTFPYTGSANITGSLTVTGSIYTDSIIYSPFIISINFETLTSYTYKSPYSFKINSVESDPSSSVTLSYVPSGSISSSNYIFGATINKFDSLTIIPLTSSLVILNSVRI